MPSAMEPYLTDLLRCKQQQHTVNVEKRLRQRKLLLQRRKKKEKEAERAAGAELRWTSFSSMVTGTKPVCHHFLVCSDLASDDAPDREAMRKLFSELLNQVMHLCGDDLPSDEVQASANFIYQATLGNDSEAAQL